MLRSAVTVVRRSSCISTGTSTNVASRRASAMAALAAVTVGPVHVERQPDHDDVGLLLAGDPGDLVRDRAACDRLRCSTTSGDAIVPDRSLTAMPIRFVPGSMPSARTPGRRAGASAVGSRVAASAAIRMRLVEPRRVLAAGRGDVALAATAATDRPRGGP